MKLNYNVLKKLEIFLNKHYLNNIYEIFETLNISIYCGFYISGIQPSSVIKILSYINEKDSMKNTILEICNQNNIDELNEILSENKTNYYKIVIKNRIYSISNEMEEVEIEEPKELQFKSPYMQILEWLVNEFKITNENQDNFVKKEFISLLNEKQNHIKQKFGIELSDKQVDTLATFVRRPQKGGSKGW